MRRKLLLLFVSMSFLIVPKTGMTGYGGFMWGISIHTSDDLLQCDSNYSGTPVDKIKEAIDETAQLGCRWFRVFLRWNEIEPVLFYRDLTSPSDITPKMVVDYIDYVDNWGRWNKYDQIIQHAQSKGVNIIFIIGTGWKHFLPMVALYPTPIQLTVDYFTDLYRACLALHVRAVVKKYKSSVRVWQLENELNTAGGQSVPLLWDWRHAFYEGGAKWIDPWFQTSLIETMSTAIKVHEDPTAVVYTNFHLLNLKIPPSAISLWKDYLDWIGLDIYRDDVFDENCWMDNFPCSAEEVGAWISYAKSESGGKPVLLAETGFNSDSTEDELRNSWQAYYLREFARAAVEHEAIGYFYFTISSIDPNTVNMGLRDNCYNYKEAYFRYKEIIPSPPEKLRILGPYCIAWNPSSEPDLAGYRVYYNNSGKPYGYGIENQYCIETDETVIKIDNLDDNLDYYCAVTAYDVNGWESCLTNEVHFQPSKVDIDYDGLTDLIEISIGSDRKDKDTDDDGLVDGNTGSEDLNVDGIVDPDETNPLNPDTDSDGLPDGLERGLTEPETEDTDISAGWFVSDSDPSATTDPTNSDSDGDGIPDGEEDLNKNGKADVGETRPDVYTLAANIDINPDTLNLKGKGKWITCYVELSEDYEPDQVDISSVSLSFDGVSIGAETSPTDIGDHNRNGTSDLMLKFDRQLVQDSIPVGLVEINVIGLLMGNNTEFQGTDTIHVKGKGKKPK